MAEEYGDDVAYGHVRVHPPSVDFIDVERGIKYVIKVAVKNVSHRQERIRFFAPPAGSGFSVQKLSTTTVAPGIEASAEVEFVLAADEDYHATLKVDVSGRIVEVPMHAYRPRAEVVLDTVVNFGPVVHERAASRVLKVFNRGRRSAKLAFDVSMVEASGDEIPAAQRRERSAFTIQPDTCQLAAGEEAELRVELDARSLGPARGLARLRIDGGIGPSLVDLAANVLQQRVELLDAKGQPVPGRLLFGQLYAGLERKLACTLVNNGPSMVSFFFSTLRDDDEPQELAEDEQLEGELSDAVFEAAPVDGQIQPFETAHVTFAFRPPQQPPSKAGFRSTRAELGARAPLRFGVGKRLNVLETEQRIDLILSGEAVAPAVSLSRPTLQFAQPCKLHDQQDALVTLSNANLEMAVDYSIDKISHFKVTPAAGRLAPGGSRELVVTFAPKQQGAMQRSFAVQLFKGSVLTLPLHVSAVCQGTNGRRRIVGGPLALPEDFAREPQFALATARPLDGGISTLALTKPVGELAQTGRTPVWQQAAVLDQALETGLGGLAKKRTFAEQMALQGALRTRDVQQTGFELAPHELAALSSHRERYTAFLRQAHADRSTREHSRFVKPAVRDVAAFELGVDLGMPSLCARGAHPLGGGWSALEPLVALPRVREPLWLEQPYDADGGFGADGGKGAHSKGLLFDDRKLIKRKHKPVPTTSEETAQCNMSLQPKELLLVTGGPKTVNFGTISVFTTVHRSFNVANDLLTHVLVSVDAHDEAELAQSSPPSQVVPPGGIAGFDLLFSSGDVGTFRKTIAYSINDRYSFKFTALAEVVPIDVELSTDELRFAFDEHDLSHQLTLPVTLFNRGTYKAEFESRGPAVTAKRPVAFVAEPATSVVEAGKHRDVLITFKPTPGAVNEHVFTFVVEGGPSRTLLCKAEVEEARCSCEPKRLDYGLVSVGIAREMSVSVKAHGAEPTVIYWDQPPAGLEIVPMVSRIAANSSVEVLFVLAAGAPLRLDAPVSAHVRGGKPIRVHVSADAQLPQVGIVEDEFAFGTVTVGARATLALTLANSGALGAALDLRLGAMAGFSVEHAAADADGPPVNAGDEAEEAEVPVQLLSTVEDAVAEVGGGRRARGDGAAASGAPPADESGGATAGGTEAAERDYRIWVRAGAQIVLRFSFVPTEEGSFDFELPIAHVGLAVSPALRRAVSARAVAALLVVSPRHLDLGSCIVRPAIYPYTAQVTVTNVDPRRSTLSWEIDTRSLAAGEVVALSPASGVLGADEVATVSVTFCPEAPCALDRLSLPVFLGDDRAKPYVTLELSARGVRPRLTFDRSEVVLPPVPLGFTSAATFLVVNDGYDNLELSYKLPADTAKVPLTLSFPEGNMVGLGREQLPVVLAFSSKKPMAFTARVFLIDGAGRRFGISVSGSTDNSPLTYQPWLHEQRGMVELVSTAGKPLMIQTKDGVDLSAPRRRASLNKRRQSKDATARAPALLPPGAPPADRTPGAPPPPLRPEWPTGGALSRALAEAEAEAEVLQPWIRAFLLDLPSQRPFPGALLAARGRPLIEILEAVSGKSLAQLVPREVQAIIARPPKSRVALARALCRQYEVLIIFLKQHGALLAELRPDDLLSRDDYVRLHAARRAAAAAAAAVALARPPATRGSMAPGAEDGSTAADNDGRPLDARLTDGERKAMLARHRLLSLRAWCNVFYQTIKVFVLARITPRALRTTPGVPELLSKSDDFENTLIGSNCSSPTEGVLLHWLTLHWRRAAPDRAVGPLARITSFEELRDGHVLAALILSHVPFLAPSAREPAADDADADAPPADGVGSEIDGGAERTRAPKPGSSIGALHPAPCSAEEAERNVQLCIEAMTTGLAVERPPSVEAIVRGSERSLILVVLGLYQTLPHYVPKATIEFAGALHEELTKRIELTNPAKRPIQYVVKLEGSKAFELPLGRVARIDARSTLAFPVTFASRFAADASARLLFLSRGDGVGVAHATTLSFVLHATITSKKPHATLSVESPLYRVAEIEVSVTNPFELACTFQIALTETRPPLDVDDASTGVGISAAAPPRVSLGGRAGAGAGAGASASATSAGSAAGSALTADSSGALDRLSELERALTRLPAAFHVASADPRKPETSLQLAPGGSATIRLQFLPFMLGEHTVELSFVDPRVGEFVYVVHGNGQLPLATDTLTFRTDAGTSTSVQLALPFRNEALEKARADALRRLAKVRDKDLEKSREPLRRSPLYFKLDFSGTYFAGPQHVELVQAEGALKARRGAGRATSTAAGLGGTRPPAATPHEGEPPPPTAGGASATSPPGSARTKVPDGAAANLVSLQFLPKQAGMYTSKLVLYSPLDVRVFNLAGNAPSPGARATLEFAAPARRAIRQELPIINATPVAWELSAVLSGQYFRGPSSLRVPAGGSEVYAIEFAPEWICESRGELVLANSATGDRFVYALSGVGEEPLAEGTVLIDVVARSTVRHEFAVYNVSADGRECECVVESDLRHVTGEPTVRVPARTGAVPFGKQQWNMGGTTAGGASRRPSVTEPPPRASAGAAGARRASALGRAPPARYSLAISPQLGGAVHGSITIRAPDGRFMWYTVEIRAAPPPAERTIDVSADVRTAAVLEVEVANPSLEAVRFDVELEGEGLLGEPSLSIGPGPNAVAKYELMFSPLVAGVSSGAISFVSAHVGEFWYKLLLTARQPPAEELGLLEVELGRSATHEVRIDNPLPEQITLRAVSTNPRIWSIGVRGGSALTLAPFGSIDALVAYSPSALSVEQRATIQLVHPRLAPWEFAVRGIGLRPTRMEQTEVSSELHAITSAAVAFVNPLEEPVTVSVTLDAPNAAEGAFALLMRRTSGIVVAPGAKLQVPFTFEARDMHERGATVTVRTAGSAPLLWEFPIVAYAESKPTLKPLTLAVRARQQLQTMLELPLVGLDDGGGPTAFTAQLQGVAEEHERLIFDSLRMQVAGPPGPNRLLPVAVQWTPLRPLKTHASIVIRQNGGGRWKYDAILHASAPEVDDVIMLEATLNRTASVSFALANAFNTEAEFSASFTAESPAVFSVRPSRGVLPRAGSEGHQFVVSFTPFEYGKMAVGVLVIVTADMQWSYEVRGKPPTFVLPEPKKRVDNRIDPAIDRKLKEDKLVSQNKNYMRRNIEQLGPPESATRNRRSDIS